MKRNPKMSAYHVCETCGSHIMFGAEKHHECNKKPETYSDVIIKMLRDKCNRLEGTEAALRIQISGMQTEIDRLKNHKV